MKGALQRVSAKPRLTPRPRKRGAALFLSASLLLYFITSYFAVAPLNHQQHLSATVQAHALSIRDHHRRWTVVGQFSLQRNTVQTDNAAAFSIKGLRRSSARVALDSTCWCLRCGWWR